MVSIAHSLVLIRALLWGVALLALLFPGTFDQMTLWGVFAGAVLGGTAGAFVERQGFVFWPRRAGFVAAGFALLGGLGMLRELGAPLGARFSETFALCLSTGGLVFGMEILRRVAMPVRLAQALLFVGVCIGAAWPHRHGHLERPYWLVERVMEFGLGPEAFWKFAAILLSLGALFILRDVPKQEVRRSVKRAVAGAVLTTLFLGGLWFALPQPPARPTPDPVPPHAPDAPPPPPPPEKLAVVRFSEFCSPTDYTDNAYLFYRRSCSELAATAGSPQRGETVSKALTALKTQVLLFSKDADIPVLIGLTGPPVPTPFDTSRFQSGWEIDALFPRDATGGPYYLRMPADRQLSKVEEALWRGIFEGDQIRATKAALRVKAELETAGKLSEKGLIPDEKWSLERFLFENTTGGALNFAVAAAELLAVAGVESRVVSGLRYDPGKGGAFHFKEAIVLTEAHATHWVEWRGPQDDWHPLFIHPQTVLDEAPPPPPEEDLENLLANQTPAPKTPAKVQAASGGQDGLDTAVAGFLIAFSVLAFLALGADLALGIEPETVVFGWMQKLLHCAGWRFDPWQGWNSLERQLSATRPAMARHFGEVRRALENIRWELRNPRPTRVRLLVVFVLFLVGFLSVKRASQNSANT